ncbi:DUF2752 domain-containing protein [Lentzea sp. NBRC 105346]|uniref:DUF2752 domain-containing protein n=1 Tax=Lentzea sp. NBRC 105346 TaxID=3032205 RepID=UPI0025547BAA|nr:DUF2752 domain-containing protein [Lentzea sp. NBRC 105346]
MYLRSMKAPLMVFAAAAAGCGVLMFVNPNSPDSWLPRCPFNWLTGLDCPACGSTRMVHALLHGDVVAAWHFNAVMLVAGLPLMAWLWLRWFNASRKGEKQKPVPKSVGVTVLATGLVWMVVRNLVA